MKRVLEWIGWGLFLYVTIRMVCVYGSEWEFGRYCMPRAAVAPDGRTYRNGRPIGEIALGIIRSGREEEILLFMFGILGGLVVFGIVPICFKIYRYEKETAPLRMFLAKAKQYKQEGKWEEVGEVLRAYDAWLARKKHR